MAKQVSHLQMLANAAARERDASPATAVARVELSGTRQRLATILKEEAGLDDDRVLDCFRTADETGQSLDRVLFEKNYAPEESLLKAFAKMLGIEFAATIGTITVPPEFVQKIPVSFSRNYNLVAISHVNGSTRIATCTPFDLQPLDDLAKMLESNVEPVLCPRAEITQLINRAYRHKADGVDDALSSIEDEDIVGLAAEIEESEDLLDVANKAPIIKLVNTVLFQALKLRASDVHLQPYPDRLQVRFRIDGLLHDMQTVPKKAQEAIISRVKVMGKMDIAERRLPQDGRASIKLGDGDVDVRISSIPSGDGERIVMRLLDKTAKIYNLDEIGLEPRNRDLLLKYLDYSHGIILVTGPTGSGKTTTLYGALTQMNSAELNILTIEDPIEYNLPGISQVQVAVKKGLTFAAGLRSFLRQDPDVLMVGEIRDLETAEIAIRAALTGHLVFSTVHTNDAPSTITRLVDIGLEPYLVSSSLLIVIAQRLVRTICMRCREYEDPDDVTRAKLREVGLSLDRLPNGKVAIGRGCEECFRSGYSGRTAIYEFMPVDDVVRTQVMNRSSATDMKRSAIERGLVTLRMDGVDKIIHGRTTADEVMRVTQLDVF
ncbi:MAG: Flp pilus assembly complex ATPase component TadA [Planctomycetes bacterium]|nr:Flp pilus assembly complex ATPase component TadA [Planctomycetota bacterium]